LPFSGSRFSAGAALLPSYPIRPGSPLRLSPVSWPALRSSLVEIERGRARGSRQSLGPYRLRPDRATERISARLHGSKRDLDARRGTLFAGLAFSSSPRAERCGSGLFLCLAGDSADWSPFSQGISWSRAVCTVLSGIPAIWGCWSVRWGGPCFSFGSRHAARGAPSSAAPGADAGGGVPPASAVRRRVRRLLCPYVTADSGALLGRARATWAYA